MRRDRTDTDTDKNSFFSSVSISGSWWFSCVGALCEDLVSTTVNVRTILH